MIEISIITVTYNSAGEIEDFVESVNNQALKVELWIVDNASTDTTVEIVKNLLNKYPWIKLITNKTNIGLAAANNAPLELLSGKFTTIVNPDVVLHTGALAALTLHLQNNQDVVAVAPLNLYGDGSPHTSFHHNWTLIHLLLWRILPGSLTHAIYRAIRTYKEQNVLFASGSCIMMRTEDFTAIGGYDPMYFLAVEDACDLCIRLRKGDNSKRVVLTPKATITHLVSRSSIGAPYILLWNSACGSIYHFRKHYGFLSGLAAYAIQFTSSVIRLINSALMSLFFPAYRSNYLNNLKVLKGLLSFKLFRKKADQ